MLRTVLTKLHWIIGITAGIVLAVVGFTGGIMSFEDEILDAVNADIVHVTPEGAPIAPAYLMKQIQNDYPDKRIQMFTISSNPNDAARVMFAPPGNSNQRGGFGGGNFGGGARPQFGGENGGGFQRSDGNNAGFGGNGGERPAQAQGQQGAAQRPGGFVRGEMRYVNPYTGELLPPAKGRQFFQTVENIHRRLLWGEIGNQIVGACTICLLALILSGLYLRWPREWKNWRIWLTYDPTKKGRFFLRSLHLVLGTWVLVFYLISGVTGMLMTYHGLNNALYDLTGTPRPQFGGPPGGAPAANAGMQSMPPNMPMNGTPPPGMMAMNGNPNAAMTHDNNGGEHVARNDEGRHGDNAGFARGGDGNSNKPAFDASAAWDAFERIVPSYSTATLRIPAPGQPIQFTYMDAVPQNKRANNRLTLDPSTLAVKQHDRYADKPLVAKLLGSTFPLHSGNFFGLPMMVLTMIASLLMPFFVITGWMMYLQRRRSAV